MNNTTIASEYEHPANSGVVTGAFAFVTLVVNIFFLATGLKTLKKKAHNMLVLSMCGADCLYGISLFSLVFINRASPQVFKALCKGQILLLFISIAMSITTALMICVERYVTVRHFNFGTLAKSDGWKKNMSVASIATTTIFVIVCMTALPSEGNPKYMCRLEYLYLPSIYQLMMGLLSGLFLSIMLSIIIVYTRVICMLFSYLKIKSQIKPFDSEFNRQNRGSEDIIDTDFSNDTLFEVTKNNESLNCCKEECIQMYDLSKTSIVDLTQANNIDTCCSSELKNESASTSAVHVITLSCKQTNVWQETTDDNKGKRSSKRSPDKNAQWTEWEHRALATSGYIIGSTVLLHGPLLACLFCDAFGLKVPPMIGNISAMLVALQCVVNPFIYAFRFKELRHAIKNILCCKKPSE